MTTLARRLRCLTIAVTTAAIALAGSRVEAQSTYAYVRYGSYFAGPSVADVYPCDRLTIDFFPGTGSLFEGDNCGVPEIASTLKGRTAPGLNLGAYADASIDADSPYNRLQLSTQTQFGDLFSFPSRRPTSVRFVTHVDASVYIVGSQLIGALGHGAGVQTPDGTVCSGYAFDRVTHDVSFTETLTCTLTGGTFAFSYLLATQINSFDFMVNPPFTPGDTVVVDAYHSATLTSLAFFDDTGNDVTATTEFTTASGLRYGLGPSSAVPEPTTLLLLAGGLGVLALGDRRRASVD